MKHSDGVAALMRLSWAARPDQLLGIRAAVQDWLEAQRAPDDVVNDLVFAVNEAATNAIEHAYLVPHGQATVELEAWTDGRELRLAVTDHGRWRPEPVDPSGFRGRGLTMMRALVHSVRVATGPTGTRVSLRHRLHEGPPPRTS